MRKSRVGANTFCCGLISRFLVSSMAISRAKKEEITKDVEEKLSDSKLVIFVNYRGLDAGNMGAIRKELRNTGVDFAVVKKTLFSLALAKRGLEADVHSLQGQVAVAFGYRDEVSPAKIIHKFTKELESFEILGGILGEEFVDKDAIVALALVPSYEELLAKMVGSMQAPISGMVNVLVGNMRGLTQVLNAIGQKSYN